MKRSFVLVLLLTLLLIPFPALGADPTTTPTPTSATSQPILFVAQTYNKTTYRYNKKVYSINPDGSALHEVAEGESPQRSPDGLWILIDNQNTAQQRTIWLASPDGTTKKNFADGHPIGWMADSHLIYYFPTKLGQSGLYYGDTDLSHKQLIAPYDVTDFAFSPDGKVFAYIYNGDVYQVTPGSGSLTPKRLATTTTTISDLQWSPDGSMMSFYSATNKLYLVDMNGKQRVISIIGYYGTPGDGGWSPDSTTLLFEGDPGSGVGLYSLDTVSMKSTLITTDPCQSPSWLPDGKTILCTGSKIFFLDPASGTKRQTPDSTANYTSFASSPDHTQIVYNTTTRLYLGNADGSNLKELVKASDVHEESFYDVVW